MADPLTDPDATEILSAFGPIINKNVSQIHGHSKVQKKGMNQWRTGRESSDDIHSVSASKIRSVVSHFRIGRLILSYDVKVDVLSIDSTPFCKLSRMAHPALKCRSPLAADLRWLAAPMA